MCHNDYNHSNIVILHVIGTLYRILMLNVIAKKMERAWINIESINR